MKLERRGGRIGVRCSSRVAVVAVLATVPFAAADAQQCPAGQESYMTRLEPTGVVRPVPVLGTTSQLASGIAMRRDRYYRLEASGSIRVGIIGETGTPPDGWVPQGPAGPGFPAPDTYSFALLYRIGSGPWAHAGASTQIRLKPSDPDGASLSFGINDNRLNDNAGVFIVNVTELQPVMGCRVPPSPPTKGFTGAVAYGKPGAARPSSSGGSAGRCAGRTPDGQPQSFQFPLYCSGTFQRNIPVEACTRAEALAEAQGYVPREANCVLAAR
jgi:hypothetical protein